MLRLRNSIRQISNISKHTRVISNIDVPKVNTHLDEINKNEKLKIYIKDIYKYSGYGFSGSIATSFVAGSIATGSIIYMPSMFLPLCGLWIGNIGFSFYSLYKISKIQSTTSNDLTEIIPQEKKKWYKLFCISNGITLTPLITMSFAIHPMIIPLALTSTIGTFAGASYYALKQNNLDAIKWQAPLMGCVTGLIGSSIVQIGASLMGFTTFAHGLDIISTLISTGVFTGLIVADTQQAIKDFQEKKLDSINTSLDLLLDATNLFIDLIKILSELFSAVSKLND